MALPDASIMLELCNILEISVNELLTGEEIDMTNYNEKAELNLIELRKQKEISDKRLLKLEVLIMVISILFMFALILIAAFIEMKTWLRFTLIGVGFVQFLICAFISIRLEQTVGYYECKHCGEKFVPTFAQINYAPHMGRTRHLKCPKCEKKSWCKKVFNKD